MTDEWDTLTTWLSVARRFENDDFGGRELAQRIRDSIDDGSIVLDRDGDLWERVRDLPDAKYVFKLSYADGDLKFFKAYFEGFSLTGPKDEVVLYSGLLDEFGTLAATLFDIFNEREERWENRFVVTWVRSENVKAALEDLINAYTRILRAKP